MIFVLEIGGLGHYNYYRVVQNTIKSEVRILIVMQNKKYKSIKELVFDLIHRTSGKIDYETITREVKKYFRNSKWKETHWLWYRYQIASERGRYKHLFSTEERSNLKSKKRQLGSDIKKIGDRILNHINFLLDVIAKDDEDFRFKLNRWVYARLQQAEIRTKRLIKKQLWNSGVRSCQAPSCIQVFEILKNVEIHRKDTSRRYLVENCILVCRKCHQKYKNTA